MAVHVELVPFVASHLVLLEGWLRLPEVAPWYANPAADLAFAAAPGDGGGHALIEVDGLPCGYTRWQQVDRDTLDALALHEIPAGSVDIDILLGDARGRGTGPAVLGLLADRFRPDPDVPLIGLTTDPQNLRAHRAFKKARFCKLRTYRPEGDRDMLLMVRDLRLER